MRRSRVRLSVAPFSRVSPASCQPFCSSLWFRLGAPFSPNFASLLPAILLFSAVSVLLCPSPWLDSFVSRPPIPSRVDLSQLCTPHAQHALVRLSHDVRDRAVPVCAICCFSPDAYPEVRVATSGVWGESVRRRPRYHRGRCSPSYSRSELAQHIIQRAC